MVNVKERFDLLKNVPNILNMSISEIKQNSIELGHRKIFVNLEQVKSRINHYTKNRIFEMVSNIKTREKQFHVLYLPGYPLPIAYNKPTKAFVITRTAWENKGTKQILITLPRDKFKGGDIVLIKKIEDTIKE